MENGIFSTVDECENLPKIFTESNRLNQNYITWESVRNFTDPSCFKCKNKLSDVNGQRDYYCAVGGFIVDYLLATCERWELNKEYTDITLFPFLNELREKIKSGEIKQLKSRMPWSYK